MPYDDIIYGGDLIILRPKKDIDSLYFSYIVTNILKKDIYRISQGVSIIHLPIDDLSKIIVKYHRLENQHKISFFLSLIDKKISLIKNKVNILKKYKKGLKKLAIKDSIDYWKGLKNNACYLSDFLTEIKEYSENDGSYNHVTLSKEGISTKTDRYDRDFLVKSEEKKYKITRYDQLCYNPANLKFGVICINKFGLGIFSPIYITFEIKNIIKEYLELIITSQDFINYSMKFQQGTVYERMSVSVEDFIKICIVPADINRQHELATTSVFLDKKISKLENELLLMKKLKTNLLKNIFI